MDELRNLIETVVEERMGKSFYPRPKDDRTVEEVLADIDRHMWTPPPVAKSSLELLREDRDA